MHNVQVTPLIGLPQLDGWSHVTQNQSGKLVWALSLHGAHARNVGRDILDLISSLEPRNSADFYAGFQQVVSQAQFKDCQFSCAAILIEDTVSTCVTFHAQILLRRNGKIGTVLDGLHTTKIIQGKIISDDLYILTTAQAVTFADEIKLKIKQGYDTDSVVTSLTPNLLLEENTSLAALAFIEISRLTEESSSKNAQIAENAQITENAQIAENAQILQNEVGDSNHRFVADQEYYEVAKEPDALSESAPELEQKYSPEIQQEVVSKIDPQIPHQGLNQDTAQDTHITIDTTKYTARANTLFKKSGYFLIEGVKNSTRLANLARKKLFLSYLPTAVGKIKPIGILLQQFVLRNSGRIISRKVYINKKASRKLLQYLTLGIVLLLIIGGIFSLWFWQRSKEIKQVKTDLAILEIQVESAKISLSDQPIIARDILLGILEQVETLKQKYEGKSVALQQLRIFSEPVAELYDEVAGREELQELPIFYSVASIEPRFITSSWTLNGSVLWLLDDEAKQIIKLNAGTKEGTLFKLEYEGRGSSLANFPESSDVMMLTSAGILRVSSQDGATSNVLENNSELDGARLLGSYGTNVYIFNTQKQNIFRVGLDESVLGTPRNWIRSSQGIEYSQIYSLAIDGDIWLTDRTGAVIRMRSGQPKAFVMRGLEKQFSSAITIYTRDDLDLLYIVEPSENRLVILNKDGGFVREIISSTIASVTTLVVSQDAQKVYVVSGGLIHEITL